MVASNYLHKPKSVKIELEAVIGPRKDLQVVRSKDSNVIKRNQNIGLKQSDERDILKSGLEIAGLNYNDKAFDGLRDEDRAKTDYLDEEDQDEKVQENANSTASPNTIGQL